MRALVTGISGFVGGELAERLLTEGHEVIGYSRDPSRVTLDIPVVAGDAASGAGLAKALKGVDVAFYNIHSFESGNDEGFETKDRRAVHNFTRAATRARIGRVVYLGVNHPPAGRPLSPHLISRFEVEDHLLNSSVPCVSVRANFIVSARNPQFRHIVALIEQLPAIVLPPFHAAKNAPLDSRDVISCLVSAAGLPTDARSTFEIGGPEVLTVGDMMRRLADVMGEEREVLENQVRSEDVTPELMSNITGIDPKLIGPLLETAELDLVPETDQSAALGLVEKIPYDQAVGYAVEQLAATPGAVSAARA